MGSPLKALQDDERFALMKFRRSVQAILEPHHDDQFLLRWLRARKWDPVAAEKMLRDRKKHGPGAGQVTVIFDMEGFNLRPLMWRPAPKVFAFAFSIAKKFMNEYTISKIQIYKADPPRWKNAILKVVSKDQLPVHFGGTLTDPDGNPRLTTKICQGGKVPKDLYVNKNDIHNEDYKTTIVRKGDKFKIELTPEKLGSILSWEFKTEDHDIKFGIVKRNDSGEKIVVPVHRVAAHQLEEVGVLTCEDFSTYSIVFDNSYSLMRNKKIFYNIRMEEPNENLQEIALRDS
ncbi:hypothetical protein G9C98_004713 [Cotesia typhae]|uniref:SEC14-like protein 2 n=1 Tax=Cotesia typhae TaxID=2053667 RepID=A0A8J5QLL7_9HYME|nr:hypothetical protein G9C98_004713 [Cotesia typhae]